MSARRSTAGALEPEDRAARARRVLRWATFAAVLVWLVAFAAGPLLHQLGHSNDHVHLPSGAVVHVDAPDHAPDDAPPPADPLDHGGGSLAHLGASAVLAGASTLVLDVAAFRYAIGEPPRSTHAPTPRWARPRSPRGPPTTPT